MLWLVVSLLSPLSSLQLTSTRCFQCSDFPSEPEDGDERLGPCPGWLRPPIMFPALSVYDGCMTIILSNGSIVAQSGVVYDYCLQLQVTTLGTLERKTNDRNLTNMKIMFNNN